jgi:hypothetical protein
MASEDANSKSTTLAIDRNFILLMEDEIEKNKPVVEEVKELPPPVKPEEVKRPLRRPMTSTLKPKPLVSRPFGLAKDVKDASRNDGLESARASNVSKVSQKLGQNYVSQYKLDKDRL